MWNLPTEENMKSPAFAVAIVLVVCCVAFGGTVYKVNSAGYYAVDENGTMVPVQIVEVGVAPVSPDIPVTPPSPSPSPELSPDAMAIKEAAEAVTDPNKQKTATALMVAVEQVQSEVGGRLSNYKEISATLGYLWGMVDRQETWGSVRKTIMDRLAGLAQAGASPGDYSAYLGDVRAGILESIPISSMDEKEVNELTSLEINWRKILQIALEIFLKYLI